MYSLHIRVSFVPVDISMGGILIRLVERRLWVLQPFSQNLESRQRWVYVSLLSYSLSLVVRIIVDTVLIDLTHAAYVITFPLVNIIALT